MSCKNTENATKKRKKASYVLIQVEGYGDIKVMLYDETPKHKENFLKLVKEDFYDGQFFHRIIKDFMIQAGDPNTKDPDKQNQLGQGGPGYTIEAEIVEGMFHTKGKLAAARQGDQVNPERRSSGSQFYIVTGRTYKAEELDRMEQQTRIMGGVKDFEFSEEVRAAYMNEGGAPWLDGQYTIFGEVVEGMEVVDKVQAVETARGDRPKEAVNYTMKIVKK